MAKTLRGVWPIRAAGGLAKSRFAGWGNCQPRCRSADTAPARRLLNGQIHHHRSLHGESLTGTRATRPWSR